MWLDGPLSPEGRVGGDLRELFLEMNGRALVLDAQVEGEAVEHDGAWEHLGEIAVPVTVVVGDLDEPAALEVARLAVDRLPDAQLEVFEGVAHLPGLEAPAALARVVRDLVHRTSAG